MEICETNIDFDLFSHIAHIFLAGARVSTRFQDYQGSLSLGNHANHRVCAPDFAYRRFTQYRMHIREICIAKIA